MLVTCKCHLQMFYKLKKNATDENRVQMCICSFNDVEGGGREEELQSWQNLRGWGTGGIGFVARFHYFISYFSNDGGGKGEREAVLY